MGVEGQTVRTAKHSNTLTSIFHLKCVIDRFDAFLMEVQGVGGKVEKEPNPQPDGPETMSLSEFLNNAPDRLHEQTERLEKLLNGLREELF